MTHSELNSMMASLGFGFAMAVALVLALSVAVGMRLSRGGILFIVVFTTFFCMCWSEFAQSIHFERALNPESVKAIGAVAAALTGLWVISKIVERAPPAALLACLAVLMGGGLIGALALYAPPKNLFLLVIVVGLLTLVAIIAICAWTLDRAHTRSVQSPRIVINHAPSSVPHLAVPPKRIEQYRGNLPAKRNPFEKWS